MSEEKTTVSGLKIKFVNIIFFVIECVFGLLVLLTFVFINANYNKLIDSVNDFTESNKSVTEFRTSADFLTNQIRLFVINQDSVFLTSYLDELNGTKGREQALEILELSHIDDDADVNLKLALDASNDLSKTELYCAKLTWLALHKQSAKIPEALLSVDLEDGDEYLSDLNKIAKAREILFDYDYLASKDKINKFISMSVSALTNESLSVQKKQGDILNRLFFLFRLFLFCLLIVSVVYLSIIIFYVIRPIASHTKKIEEGEKMGEIGSYETRYIASAYNSLLDKNEIKASILKHKAEHDSLTGLINRGAFDQIKNIIKESTESVAYLIIDIDFFKQINDNYGHSTGDVVLKKISSLLNEQFRNTDYVARIGGDEFAVLMTKIGENPESVIQRKISSLNTILQNLQDGLPSVSLSVGVSISDNGYEEEMEKQADEALYRVKKGGRCNCSFYKFQ